MPCPNDILFAKLRRKVWLVLRVQVLSKTFRTTSQLPLCLVFFPIQDLWVHTWK